jgi:hypothetical protein
MRNRDSNSNNNHRNRNRNQRKPEVWPAVAIVPAVLVVPVLEYLVCQLIVSLCIGLYLN